MLLALPFEQLCLFLGCWRRVTLVPEFQSSEGKRPPNPNPKHHGETPDEGPGRRGGGAGAGRAGSARRRRRAPPWPPPAGHQRVVPGKACRLSSSLCLAFLLTDAYSSSFSGTGGLMSDVPRPGSQSSPATGPVPPGSLRPPPLLPPSLPFHLCCQESQSSLRFSYLCCSAFRVAVALAYVTLTHLSSSICYSPCASVCILNICGRRRSKGR